MSYKKMKQEFSGKPGYEYLFSLISVTNYLLDRQIVSLERKFIREGGYSENLAKKRREFRGF